MGLRFAFMNFYTSWLALPAVFGLIAELNSLGNSREITVMSFVYSFIVCFWISFFTSRWKRKENELLTHWGLSQTKAVES